jgi:hypothetical protein
MDSTPSVAIERILWPFLRLRWENPIRMAQSRAGAARLALPTQPACALRTLNVGQVGIVTDIGKLLAEIGQRGKTLPTAQEMVGGGGQQSTAAAGRPRSRVPAAPGSWRSGRNRSPIPGLWSAKNFVDYSLERWRSGHLDPFCCMLMFALGQRRLTRSVHPPTH